jgi:hypothetical protein
MQTPQNVPELERIHEMVYDLGDIHTREKALLELSKNRETVSDLARIIWYSFGTITALLQEIVSIYPLLSPPKLKAQASNRVCNALALLQCVASHPETRPLFIQGKENLNNIHVHIQKAFLKLLIPIWPTNHLSSYIIILVSIFKHCQPNKTIRISALN